MDSHISENLKSNIDFNVTKHMETFLLTKIREGCESWSLKLREEHRLRAYENRVLRRIFGPKRAELTGGCRKLHNEELHNLYSSPSIIRMIKSRRMRWAGHVAQMGENRNAFKGLYCMYCHV
jgi:hypothetical protein